jgi:hypothetical protein
LEIVKIACDGGAKGKIRALREKKLGVIFSSQSEKICSQVRGRGAVGSGRRQEEVEKEVIEGNTSGFHGASW